MTGIAIFPSAFRFAHECALTLRIQHWAYLLGIAFLALWHHSGPVNVGKAANAIVFCGIYLCSGYMLNNWHDRDEDLEAKNRFKVWSERASLQVTWALHAGLAVLAILNQIGIETLCVFGLNYVYSVRPLRLKRFLPAALVCNGVFFAFLYYASAKIVANQVSPEAYYFVGYVFLFFLPLQYVHFLEHLEESGSRAGIWPRLGLVAFLAVPCIYTAIPDLGSLHRFHVGTVAFSFAALIAVLALRSASVARVAVRLLGLLLGFVLI